MDNLTKIQRSFCMSKIRSKCTKPEMLVHNLLEDLKIKHKMHPKIDGSPDLIIPDKHIAIFVNGCFWHKCPLCYKEPKTRKEYWVPKINKNIQRDIKNKYLLKNKGWKVISIWEHQLKNKFEDKRLE